MSVWLSRSSLEIRLTSDLPPLPGDSSPSTATYKLSSMLSLAHPPGSIVLISPSRPQRRSSSLVRYRGAFLDKLVPIQAAREAQKRDQAIQMGNQVYAMDRALLGSDPVEGLAQVALLFRRVRLAFATATHGNILTSFVDL